MATLDGMPLFDSAGPPTSGGAFLLNGVANSSLTASAPGGWTVQVAAGGRYVVARSQVPLGGYQECLDAAFRAAQQGLDLFSISRAADLGVKDAEAEHLTWWPEAAGPVLRTTPVLTISPLLAAKITVTDAAGNVLPDPPKPPAVWHESLRYFRLAQVTDDLFDAYRNLYLALEALLDRIAPQAVNAAGKPTEGEGAWFRRALGVAHALVGLAPYVAKGSTDPVGDLFNELYAQTRTGLFHAKASRSSLLPHTPGPEKAAVTAAVDRLSSLCMALAEKELGTRSATGGFFQAGFDGLTGHWKARLRLHATDDAAAAKPDNTVLNPSGGTVIDLGTRHAPELEGLTTRSFLGTATGEELDGLSRLTAVAASLDGTPVAYGTIEGVLILSGVGRLEGQMALRLRNPRMLKRHFAS